MVMLDYRLLLLSLTLNFFFAYAISLAAKELFHKKIKIKHRITSYNVCYTKLLRNNQVSSVFKPYSAGKCFIHHFLYVHVGEYIPVIE